ncbi:hypothetical protein ACU4GD_30595 [Cupriavidus basilensis]
MPRQPAGNRAARGRAWLLAFGAIFLYHALLLYAFAVIPASRGPGLLAYLWPLLMVLFSALAPGGSLGRRQVAAAARLLGTRPDRRRYSPGSPSASSAGGQLAWVLVAWRRCRVR